jgi:hypothetical protein
MEWDVNTVGWGIILLNAVFYVFLLWGCLDPFTLRATFGMQDVHKAECLRWKQHLRGWGR